MTKNLCRCVVPLLSLFFVALSVQAADDYDIDSAHSSVSFRVSHLGLTWIHGRFNDVAGKLVIDKDDPTKSTFAIAIRAESIDTAQKKRDDHLRSPDFFNSKQFPDITFKSTAVKAVEKGYEVTGDFTMHGVTKPVTVKLLGGKTAEFPKGTFRIGFYADFTVKRSDYGIGDPKFKQALGDEVYISMGVEGMKK